MRGLRISVAVVFAGFALLVVTSAEETAVHNRVPACGQRADDGRVLWNGDFETAALDQWRGVLRASPEGVAVVDSPVRQGGYAARLTVADSDVVGGNPRAQLNAPGMHHEGDEHFIGWSTYFPGDFPSVPSGGWLVFFQFHGEPYSGSPRLGFGVGSDRRIELRRDDAYDFDRVWSGPLVRGRWIDFTARIKWSRDPSVGFIEMWVDGRRMRFSHGDTRLAMATIQEDQDVVESIATNYRKLNTIKAPVTILHDAVKIGTSCAAVQPRSPAGPRPAGADAAGRLRG